MRIWLGKLYNVKTNCSANLFQSRSSHKRTEEKLHKRNKSGTKKIKF